MDIVWNHDWICEEKKDFLIDGKGIWVFNIRVMLG